MKRQAGLVRTSVLSILLSSTALVFTGAMAQAADMPVKAVAKPIPYWWFHGTLEVGGRFFLNDPNRDGSYYKGQKSLASYYEYTDVAPGALGNADISLGTSDGIYEIDAGGQNIGYDDQSYYLDYSQAGTLYIHGAFDETPHLYSTSAQTFYQGVGTATLMLPTGYTPADTSAAQIDTLNSYLHHTDIGIRRDTASVSARWTPDSAWDIKANYSHMHRHGTQIDGVVGTGYAGPPGFASGHGFPYGPTEVPRPVDDTTQNYGLNGEYAGTSSWGQRFTFKLAYNGSNYDDSLNGYTLEVPFTNGPAYPVAQMGTWPSNRADAFGGTLAMDLPANNRYVGHVSYNMMRQNDAFVPMSPNDPTYDLVKNSLDGKINTLLSDNVLTTKLTSELTSKLTYRYYNFDNQTGEMFWPDVVHYGGATGAGEGYGTIAPAYTKQNVGAALNWRPSREWNIGGAYGWERYDYTRYDTNRTTENSGKVHVDWIPTSWFTLRSSGYYASRRYDNYDYYQYVASQIYETLPDGYSPAYRQFFLDNRDRWKANFIADLVVVQGLTVSPFFKYQEDDYGLASNESGVNSDHFYSVGADVTYLVNPSTSLMFGYAHLYGKQLVNNCNCNTHSDNTLIPTYANYLETNDQTTVDSFTTVARWAAIPNTLDLSLRYTLSHEVDNVKVYGNPGGSSLSPQFPNVTTWYNRLDAKAVYTFDKATVAKLGWKGLIKAKLHYVWESNSVDNWSMWVAPYNPAWSSGAALTAMAWNNPNYNVQMLIASLSAQW